MLIVESDTSVLVTSGLHAPSEPVESAVYYVYISHLLLERHRTFKCRLFKVAYQADK